MKSKKKFINLSFILIILSCILSNTVSQSETSQNQEVTGAGSQGIDATGPRKFRQLTLTRDSSEKPGLSATESAQRAGDWREGPLCRRTTQFAIATVNGLGHRCLSRSPRPRRSPPASRRSGFPTTCSACQGWLQVQRWREEREDESNQP